MVVAPRAFVQSGPIFLDELICTESDTTLQGCSRGIAGIGLTSCNHNDDVWVQCSGKYLMDILWIKNSVICTQIPMSVVVIMEDVNITAPTLLVATTVHAFQKAIYWKKMV